MPSRKREISPIDKCVAQVKKYYEPTFEEKWQIIHREENKTAFLKRMLKLIHNNDQFRPRSITNKLLSHLFVMEVILNTSLYEWLCNNYKKVSYVRYRVLYFKWRAGDLSMQDSKFLYNNNNVFVRSYSQLVKLYGHEPWEVDLERHNPLENPVVTKFKIGEKMLRGSGPELYSIFKQSKKYYYESKWINPLPKVVEYHFNFPVKPKNPPYLKPPPLSPNIPPVKNNITKKQRISPTIDNTFRYQKQAKRYIEPPPKQIEPDTTIYPIIEVTLTEEMRDSLCVVNMQPIVDYYNKLIEADRTWLHWCSCTQRKLTAKIREEINKQNMVPPWWQSNFGQFELDHIIRIEAGGLTAPENLVIMLPELNRSENGCDATNQTKRSLIGEKNLCKATGYCNNISNAYIKILEKT